MSTDSGTGTGTDGTAAPRSRREQREQRERAQAATSPPPPGQRPRRRLGFGRTFAIVVAAILVVGVTGAALSLNQGPRTTGVVVDPDGLADASGQRVVLTLNQPVADVDPAQVTVEPAADFTVDTSGRSLGVQFTYPLDRDTEYTVTIDGVTGAQGGPSATLRETFRTGSPPLYLLQRRADGDDAVFSMNLTGDEAFEVFTAPQIDDYRAARDGIVVQTSDDDGASSLTVVTAGDDEPQPVAVPGVGVIAFLQLADRGGLFGYTYGDLDISADRGIEAGLYLGSRSDPSADPVRVRLGDDDRIAQWAFIPDTTFILALSFDGQLWLADSARPTDEAVLVGNALAIAGVEAGSGRAIVERVDGTRVLNLTDLSEEPLVAPDDADSLGQRGAVVPLVGGDTLRQFTQMGEDGYPVSQHVLRVGSDGSVATVFDLDRRGDGILQVCASPSGEYAAIAIAPNLVDNPYDGYARPLPERVEIHIVEIAIGDEVTVVTGSDLSWCRVAPQ